MNAALPWMIELDLDRSRLCVHIVWFCHWLMDIKWLVLSEYTPFLLHLLEIFYVTRVESERGGAGGAASDKRHHANFSWYALVKMAR